MKAGGAISLAVAFLMLSSAALPVVVGSVPTYVSYNVGAASKYHAPVSGMGVLALSHAFSGVISGSSAPGAAGTPPPIQSIPTGLTWFINDSSYAPQSETTVAADPANPSHVVGGYNDGKWFFCPDLLASECPNGYTDSVTGFTTSTDGGTTVAKSNDLPGVTATEKNLTSGVSSSRFLLSWGDPSIVPATDGTFYFASLAVDPNSGANGVMLEKSNADLFNPGVSCATPINQPDTNPCWTAHLVYANLTYQCAFGLCGTTSFEDKETVAVDTNPTSPDYGSVYVAWDHFNADGTSSSYVARCTPSLTCTMVSGGSASPVSGSDPFAGNATPTVGPDGTVYVGWCNFGTFSTYGPVYCSIRSSPAGGASFGTVHSVMSFMGAGTQLSGDTVIIGYATEQFRTASELTLVAGAGGDVYFAIPLCTSGFYYRFLNDPLLPSDNPGNCGNSAIFFSRSTDGGVDWSSPTQVSAQAVVVQPSLAFDPKTGGLVLAYYTSQYDSFNHRIDVVVAVSNDQGQSFTSFRVTPVSNEPDADPTQFDYTIANGFGGSLVVPQYGDYFTAWAYDGRIWVLFTGNYAQVQGTFKESPFLAVVGETPSTLNFSSVAKDAAPGDTITFRAGGFTGGSPLALTLDWNGETISLANATVPQNGVVSGNFTVPNVQSQVYTVVARDGSGLTATAHMGVGQVSLNGVQSALASLRNTVNSLGSAVSAGFASLNSTVAGATGSLATSISSLGSTVSTSLGDTKSTTSVVEYLAIVIVALLVVVIALQLRKGRGPEPQAPAQQPGVPGSA